MSIAIDLADLSDLTDFQFRKKPKYVFQYSASVNVQMQIKIKVSGRIIVKSEPVNKIAQISL